MQISPTSQHQAKAAELFANSISSKQFCIQTAYGDSNRKPFVTSTTFYENFVDAKTAFDVHKRQKLEQQKSDYNNAFNLGSSSMKMLEIAAEFYRGYDVYAMLGTKQKAEPVQSSH